MYWPFNRGSPFVRMPRCRSTIKPWKSREFSANTQKWSWICGNGLDDSRNPRSIERDETPAAREWAQSEAIVACHGRIKFADAAAAEELFDNLDADLRGFVGSTRPAQWEGGA